MNDKFFEVENCDRCGAKLVVRTMSWFTDETICLVCSDKEDKIKHKLRAQGKNPSSFEGCGSVPRI